MERVYQTERLYLKVLDKSHAEPVLDYINRNREFLKEWEPERAQAYYTIPYQEKLLTDEFESIAKGQMLKLWVAKKEERECIIGYFAFTNIVRHAFLSCFLGYALDKAEINKGYMTEALRKGIELIFDEYKLHRIEANIMPKNKRSLQVVKKLGFHDEGTAKEYLNINGIWEDHKHMVLLNHKL